VLIQTAERRHAREIHLANPRAWFPYNAVDQWWRLARRAPDPEMLALRMLDRWRDHATWQLAGGLFGPQMNGFLEVTGAMRYARMLDKMSVSPATAISTYRKLRANYSGACFRVARSSDSLQLDIYPIGDTADYTQVISHCGAANGNVDLTYDQSGNARNWSSSSTFRPRIYNGSAVDVYSSGGRPAMLWDGVDDKMIIASNLGFTGDNSITVAMAVEHITLGGGSGFKNVFFSICGTTAVFSAGMLDATHVALSNLNDNRSFVANETILGNPTDWTFSRTAGDGNQIWKHRPHATACVQNGSAGTGSTTLGGTGEAGWGKFHNLGFESQPSNMRSNLLIVWASDLIAAGGNDLIILDTELTLHTEA